MRFHLRFPIDDGVDRPDLDAQQCVEVTGTNTPTTTHHPPLCVGGVDLRTVTKSSKHSKFARVHYAVSDTAHPYHRAHPHSGGCCSEGVSVVDSGRETPGPIPNPEAKPARDDGTAPGRVWESRLPPTLKHTQLNRHDPRQGSVPRSSGMPASPGGLLVVPGTDGERSLALTAVVKEGSPILRRG